MTVAKPNYSRGWASLQMVGGDTVPLSLGPGFCTVTLSGMFSGRQDLKEDRLRLEGDLVPDNNPTVEEQLALAVLSGDKAAALALADKVREEWLEEVIYQGKRRSKK